MREEERGAAARGEGKDAATVTKASMREEEEGEDDVVVVVERKASTTSIESTYPRCGRRTRKLGSLNGRFEKMEKNELLLLVVLGGAVMYKGLSSAMAEAEEEEEELETMNELILSITA
ncbi:hypothetical protein Droror1_Dr00015878 [Drosera rotundifolia]